MLPFCLLQCQRCIKIRVLRAQDFYTPLALKTAKGQHLQALEVYNKKISLPLIKGVDCPPLNPPRPSPRVPEECAPESEKSTKTQLRTLFGLFSDSGAHSSGTLGRPGTPFRTLFGLFWGRAREPIRAGRGGPPTPRP